MPRTRTKDATVQIVKTSGSGTKSKPKKPKRVKLHPRYDFAETHRGNCCLLVDQRSRSEGALTNKLYIRMAEMPASLLSAYRSGVLTGEAETLARALLAAGGGLDSVGNSSGSNVTHTEGEV